MDVKLFKEHLRITEIPKELELLIEFENSLGFENYADGFGIYIDNLNHWSVEPEFQERLRVLGQANGSGSHYAFWEDIKGRNLGEMPIVVFGDEGGVHIVSENLLQLMHVLTFDCEISVDWDDAYFCKYEDEYQETEGSLKYRAWLKEKFNLDTIGQEQVNELVLNAQEKYKTNFEDWIKQFLDL